MRAVVQRVTRAQVRVASGVVGKIGPGLCVLVAVLQGDRLVDARTLAKKVAQLRIFTDADEKMNLNVQDAGGAILAISQFTLAGDVRKGNRPSFIKAMAPEPALQIFNEFCVATRSFGLSVATGVFRAEMAVELVNDGPVTILLDTERAF